MGRLLVVHHTTSPSLQELLDAVLAGAGNPDGPATDVVTQPALVAGVVDLMAADAVILGTPANIGYMSGALKHFFDTVYYPCLTDRTGLPYATYVHGNNDTTGAVRAIESIATGMSWRRIRPPMQVTGPVGARDRDGCWELGAVLALAAAGDA
jgi:NAD(P)H-dependent FMN reductase